MLKAVEVNLDVNEMVLKLDNVSDPTHIGYNKLDRLVRVREPVRKLLRTIEVKGIEVYARGLEEPIVITSNNVGDFDRVEGYLLQVAKKYDVEIAP